MGGSFILSLLSQSPQRISAAVIAQPIGLDNNLGVFREPFAEWVDSLRSRHPETEHPKTGSEEWENYYRSLYHTGSQFFSVEETAVRSLTTPVVILEGNDDYHPRSTSLA